MTSQVFEIKEEKHEVKVLKYFSEDIIFEAITSKAV